MGSSAASSPPLRPRNPCYDLRLCCPPNLAPFRPATPFWRSSSSKRRTVRLFSSPPGRWPFAGAWSSWLHQEGSGDGFGGWLAAQPVPEKRSEASNYFPRFPTVVTATSVAVLLAAFVHFSFFGRGSKLQFNMLLHYLHGQVMPSESGSKLHCEDKQISEKILEDMSATVHDTCTLTMKDDRRASEEKKRIIPVAADSTQQKALFVLKKLKIVEDNVKPDELCTRREYARWLVKANSLLERNPKHKIVLSEITSSSTVPAFDDVNVDDPDFWCIQALGEVGIVPCKLLGVKSNVSEGDSSVNCGTFDFRPESFLSRLDLINWRAQLEYLFCPAIEEKSRC